MQLARVVLMMTMAAAGMPSFSTGRQRPFDALAALFRRVCNLTVSHEAATQGKANNTCDDGPLNIILPCHKWKLWMFAEKRPRDWARNSARGFDRAPYAKTREELVDRIEKPPKKRVCDFRSQV